MLPVGAMTMQSGDKKPSLAQTGADARAPLSDDLLIGADAIAAFVYGDTQQRRKIYHLAQTNRIPVFKLGSSVCARRSTLLRWIEQQELRAIGPKD